MDFVKKNPKNKSPAPATWLDFLVETQLILSAKYLRTYFREDAYMGLNIQEWTK